MYNFNTELRDKDFVKNSDALHKIFNDHIQDFKYLDRNRDIIYLNDSYANISGYYLGINGYLAYNIKPLYDSALQFIADIEEFTMNGVSNELC